MEIEPVEVFTKDTKNLVVSPYVIWKINDPVVFMERIRNMKDAQRPIEDLVTSKIASAIGRLDFSEIFGSSDKNSSNTLLPKDLIEQTNTSQSIGNYIDSISIEKLSLPIQNSSPYTKGCKPNVQNRTKISF